MNCAEKLLDRLVKPGIEPATPGLQGKRFIHYTTAAPTSVDVMKQTCVIVFLAYFTLFQPHSH